MKQNASLRSPVPDAIFSSAISIQHFLPSTLVQRVSARSIWYFKRHIRRPSFALADSWRHVPQATLSITLKSSLVFTITLLLIFNWLSAETTPVGMLMIRLKCIAIVVDWSHRLLTEHFRPKREAQLSEPHENQQSELRPTHTFKCIEAGVRNMPHVTQPA